MSSFFRRAGAQIAKVLESSSDPGGAPNELQIYTKDVAGVTQLFCQRSDGSIVQIGGAWNVRGPFTAEPIPSGDFRDYR